MEAVKETLLEFVAEPVPMQVACKVLKMNPNTIRNLMESGQLDIGALTKKPKQRGHRPYRNVYISPKKFYELTGFLYKGGEKDGKQNIEKESEDQEII